MYLPTYQQRTRQLIFIFVKIRQHLLNNTVLSVNACHLLGNAVWCRLGSLAVDTKCRAANQ
ncbi:hypothetical protein T4E_6074 [Trichinella pseudospiralis]|uniref:Uncharacterized protein n=1 Tax=Trichinella pseudospiralis TaxID=6337 RepID=A0A0V0YE63_TRIPS|nr:hypothetical protein T4E_6074 [Trichinella pseudospiralis]